VTGQIFGVLGSGFGFHIRVPCFVFRDSGSKIRNSDLRGSWCSGRRGEPLGRSRRWLARSSAPGSGIRDTGSGFGLWDYCRSQVLFGVLGSGQAIYEQAIYEGLGLSVQGWNGEGSLHTVTVMPPVVAELRGPTKVMRGMSYEKASVSDPIIIPPYTCSVCGLGVRDDRLRVSTNVMRGNAIYEQRGNPQERGW